MCTNTGQYFGDIIWCIISVAEGGLLSLTQQMSSFDGLGNTATANQFNDHNHSTNHQSPPNPFEPNMRNLHVQRIKDSEMQIDEDQN